MKRKLVLFICFVIGFFAVSSVSVFADKTIGLGETTSIKVTCSDPDGNLDTCEVTSPCSNTCNVGGSSGTCSCDYTSSSSDYNNDLDMCGKATDKEGKTDTSCPNTLHVRDLTGPDVYALYYPAIVTTNDMVTYNATASDDYAGLKNIKIYVDGSLKKTCLSSPCKYTEGPYANGSTHQYYAIAEDNDGNTAKTQGDSFEVFGRNIAPTDYSPPRGTITHFPLAVTDSDEVTYNVIATDSFTGIRTIKIFVDGQMKKKCSSSPCNYTGGPYTFGSKHTYYTKVWDAVGNMARIPLTGVKSFIVGCTGIKCLNLSVLDDKVHLKPMESGILNIEILSTSQNMETTELYVEGWKGKYEFMENTCSACLLSGPTGDEDSEISVDVPSGGTKIIQLKIIPINSQRPGRYNFKIKNR